jgi:hypothetical protein
VSAQEPTEEQLRQAFEEQMRRLTVPDVLVQTAVTLVNLGGQKLEEEHDLEQVKAAIEATRALLPMLPEEVHKPIKDALSQLQMAYVKESQQPAPEGEQAEEPDEEAERAKARSKIWTPPGT